MSGCVWALIAVGGLFAVVICAVVAIGALTLLGQRVEPKVITSSDGVSQVTAPGTWEERDDLNDSAELQVANARQEQYLVVLTESKEDLSGADLEEYAEIVSDNIASSIDAADVSDAESIEIQGQPAVQYRIAGTIDDLDAVYWVTAIEGEEHFHQVIAWTLASMVDENETVLKEVIDSFQEVEP